MSAIDDPLAGLLSTDTYKELMRYREPFDMFRAMRHHIGENESSSILRFLVSSDETHSLGTGFLREWMKSLGMELGSLIGGLPDVDFQHSTAEVEWLTSEDRRLDLLIFLKDSRGEDLALIGVENKHWAMEQLRQVADYQESLAARANGLPSCVLFLTPDGKDPETGRDLEACPWLAVSYLTVLEAIKSIETQAEPEVRAFLASFRNHLATNLHHSAMTDTDKNTKCRVHELFKNPEHRKAMLLLEQMRPSGGSLLARLGESLEWPEVFFEKYPPHGDRVQEAQWFPNSLDGKWEEVPVSVAYQLTSGKVPWDTGVEVQVAVLAWCEGISDLSRLRAIGGLLTENRPAAATWPQEKWEWDSWTPIWVGGKHMLSDLQGTDEQATLALLEDAHKRTHNWLRVNMERHETL